MGRQRGSARPHPRRGRRATGAASRPPAAPPAAPAHPLATVKTAAALLAPLGGESQADFDPDRFARWRAAFGPPGRGRAPASTAPPLPPLLIAAAAAQGWIEAGISPRPSAVQAFAVAALLLA